MLQNIKKKIMILDDNEFDLLYHFKINNQS